MKGTENGRQGKLNLKVLVKKINLRMILGFFSLNSRCWWNLSSLFGKNTTFYLCQVLFSINTGNTSCDVVTEHIQRVPGKPFARIFLRKRSGKVSERQSHAGRITTCSQLTYHSLKTLTCSNTKPRQHHISPITPGAGSTLSARQRWTHTAPAPCPGFPQRWGHPAGAKVLQR